MSSQVRFRIALLLIASGGLAFRLPCLNNRPMHADEAVHAYKFRELREEGTYRYDPTEYHGPTLYYATLPMMVLRRANRFADTTENDYRIVTVVFGAGIILLLAFLADGLGGSATLCAATLIAVSPAFVFYSRYYIQETLLVFFSLGMLGTGWRFTRTQGPVWLISAGLCAGLMLATKETAVLSLGAAAVALCLITLQTRPVKDRAPGLQVKCRSRDLILASLAGLLTASLLLSSLFTHPSSLIDYIRACTTWLHRAGSSDLHQHPWYYYLQILIYTHRHRGPVWSEGLIVGLAMAGMITAFFCPPSRLPGAQVGLIRFVSLYTLALTAAYTLIPYKTPWCALEFLKGMEILAGVGAVALIRLTPRVLVQAVIGVLLFSATAQLAWQAYRSSYVYYTDGSNPYVYAATVPDAEDLGARVEALAQVSPQREAMVVKVFSVDEYYWPLPWYLRRFPNVGYWRGVPVDVEASVVIASPRFEEQLARRLRATHLMTGYFGLRPAVLLQVWVRRDLWSAFLETRKTHRRK